MYGSKPAWCYTDTDTVIAIDQALAAGTDISRQFSLVGVHMRVTMSASTSVLHGKGHKSFFFQIIFFFLLTGCGVVMWLEYSCLIGQCGANCRLGGCVSHGTALVATWVDDGSVTCQTWPETGHCEGHPSGPGLSWCTGSEASSATAGMKEHVRLTNRWNPLTYHLNRNIAGSIISPPNTYLIKIRS